MIAAKHTWIVAVFALAALACGPKPAPPDTNPPPEARPTDPAPNPQGEQKFAEPPPGDEAEPVAKDKVAHGAPPTCAKADCPHAPMYPTKDCGDGLHTGGRGPCVRFDTGKCGWIRLTCPESECDPSDCSPAPAHTEWSCAGSQQTAGFFCVRGRSGKCGWTLRRCRRP